MATPFNVATGDAQAVKIFSKLMMVAAIQKTMYSKFAGPGPDNAFQILTDLTKGPGDQIKFDLLEQMTGYGINGNTAMISAVAGSSTNESNLIFRQETVEVEQKRLAHAWYRMAQQRSLHDMMKASMGNLSDRWAVIIDRWAACHLVGLAAAGLHANDTDGVAAATDIANHATTSGGAGIEAHDANHIYAVNQAALFQTVEHLNPMRWKAETMTIPNVIQPLRADGNDAYVVFIRPEQAASLQGDAEWVAAQSNAGLRGSENPLFSGMFGFWNGMAIKIWQYLPYGITAGATVRHAILVGKQAVAVAFGNAFDSLDQEKYGKDFVFAFVPREQSDYGNIKGVSAGAVFGMQRIMFNGATHGCIRATSTDPVI
jgi:N4-gp56 family major capsid protein